jgi:Flp pilus assembly protein TadB
MTASHDVGLVFAIDRNLMRMYVILVLAALLLLGLSCLAAYFVTARRKARKRQAVAARLEAAVAQATRESEGRRAAAQASAALTTVLPAIQPDERAPRRVA